MGAMTMTQFDAVRWLTVLLDSAVKGAVVLAMAGIVSLLLRRGSSALRHMVWTCAAAGLVLIPALSIALPRWQVPLLPDWARPAATESPAPPVAAAEPALEPPAPAAEPPALNEEPAPPQPARPTVHEPAKPVTAAAPAGDSPAPAAVAATPKPPNPKTLPATHWSAWVLLAWAAGAAVMLLPLMAGTLLIWRQARRATRIAGEGWTGLLGELCMRLGIRRRVGLLRSADSLIPVTWGFRRPMVMLPPESDGWTPARRRIVLLHELAHVRRGDCLTQMLLALVRAAYWFNPLVYVAARQLRIERERACDDLVLASGHRPSEYASHLLEIVRTLRHARCPSLAAVAMAKKSHFEGRVLAILDPRRNRRSLTRLAAAVVLLLVAGVVVPLSIVKATAAQDKPATEPSAATTQPTTRPAAWTPPASWPKDALIQPRLVLFYPQELEDSEATLASAVSWTPDGKVVPLAETFQLSKTPGWPQSKDRSGGPELVVVYDIQPGFYVETSNIMESQTGKPLEEFAQGLFASGPQSEPHTEYRGWNLAKLAGKTLPETVSASFFLEPTLDGPNEVKFDPHTVELPLPLWDEARIVRVFEDDKGWTNVEVEADPDAPAWKDQFISLSVEGKDEQQADHYNRDPLKRARLTRYTANIPLERVSLIRVNLQKRYRFDGISLAPIREAASRRAKPLAPDQVALRGTRLALTEACERAMPKNWSVTFLTRGSVSPVYWDSGQGWKLDMLRTGNFDSCDWTPEKGGTVTLWVMDAGYNAKGPGRTGWMTRGGTTLSAAKELESWHGRRAFVEGTGGPDWPDVEQELTAALREVSPDGPTSRPAPGTSITQPAGKLTAASYEIEKARLEVRRAEQESEYRRAETRHDDAACARLRVEACKIGVERSRLDLRALREGVQGGKASERDLKVAELRVKMAELEAEAVEADAGHDHSAFNRAKVELAKMNAEIARVKLQAREEAARAGEVPAISVEEARGELKLEELSIEAAEADAKNDQAAVQKSREDYAQIRAEMAKLRLKAAEAATQPGASTQPATGPAAGGVAAQPAEWMAADRIADIDGKLVLSRGQKAFPIGEYSLSAEREDRRCYAFLDYEAKDGSKAIFPDMICATCDLKGNVSRMYRVSDFKIGMASCLWPGSLIWLGPDRVFLELHVNPSLNIGVTLWLANGLHVSIPEVQVSWNPDKTRLAWVEAPPHGMPPEVKLRVVACGKDVCELPQDSAPKLNWSADGKTLIVEVGDKVVARQEVPPQTQPATQLAETDKAIAEYDLARLEAARVSVNRRRAQVAKAEEAAKQGAATDAEVESARMALKLAEMELEAVQCDIRGDNAGLDKLRLEAARLQLDARQKELKRLLEAAQKGAASAIQVEQAQVDVRLAELGVKAEECRARGDKAGVEAARLEAARLQLDAKQKDLKRLWEAARKGAATAGEVEQAQVDVKLEKLKVVLQEFEVRGDKAGAERVRLEAAKLQLEAKQKTLNRLLEAARKGAASQDEIERARFEVRWAELALELLDCEARGDQAGSDRLRREAAQLQTERLRREQKALEPASAPAPPSPRPETPAPATRPAKTSQPATALAAHTGATRQTDGDWSYPDYAMGDEHNARNEMVLLLTAASKGDLVAVKKAIEADPELATAQCPRSNSSYGVLGVWVMAQNSYTGTEEGATALHAAAGGGRKEIVEYLLSKGSDVNAADRARRTPLHYAAKAPPEQFFQFEEPGLGKEKIEKKRDEWTARQKAVAEVLLKKNADTTVLDGDGQTPLATAAETENKAIAELLLSQGAKLDVFSAIHLGMTRELGDLLDKDTALANRLDGHERSPLDVAADRGNAEMAKLLLAHKADAGGPKHDDSPLAWAVNSGNAEVVRLLLDVGADPNKANLWGQPLLSHAAQNGSLKVVQLLVERGAKLDAAGMNIGTPLQEAARFNHKDVVDYLLSEGAADRPRSARGSAGLESSPASRPATEPATVPATAPAYPEDGRGAEKVPQEFADGTATLEQAKAWVRTVNVGSCWGDGVTIDVEERELVPGGDKALFLSDPSTRGTGGITCMVFARGAKGLRYLGELSGSARAVPPDSQGRPRLVDYWRLGGGDGRASLVVLTEDGFSTVAEVRASGDDGATAEDKRVFVALFGDVEAPREERKEVSQETLTAVFGRAAAASRPTTQAATQP